MNVFSTSTHRVLASSNLKRGHLQLASKTWMSAPLKHTITVIQRMLNASTRKEHSHAAVNLATRTQVVRSTQVVNVRISASRTHANMGHVYERMKSAILSACAQLTIAGSFVKKRTP